MILQEEALQARDCASVVHYCKMDWVAECGCGVEDSHLVVGGSADTSRVNNPEGEGRNTVHEGKQPSVGGSRRAGKGTAVVHWQGKPTILA